MAAPDNGHDDDDDDRRIHTRYRTSLSVNYTSGDTFLFAYLSNISEMGIFVRTEQPLAMGSELRLRFEIANQDPLLVDGVVAWINPVRPERENHNPGMGIQFRGLTAALREQVVALVRTVAYLRKDDLD